MISTFFFLLLLAFQLWYLTSPQVKIQPVGYQVYVKNNPQNARIVGSILLAATAALFVLNFGLMAGLCAWLVGLMAVGGLIVALAPFRYLNMVSVVSIYLIFLVMELAF